VGVGRDDAPAMVLDVAVMMQGTMAAYMVIKLLHLSVAGGSST